MSNQLATIRADIESVRPTFTAMAGDALSFEKEAGFAIQVLMANDYAQGIAMSNRQSVISAVTNVAAIGISLNPAKRQAYLVPRDGKICLDISYMGLLDLAIQSGSILWGQAELVFSADRFELAGFDRPPLHNRDPFSTERGEVVGAYVVVKTRDGDYLTTTMPIGEINDIRDRSAAWKGYLKTKRTCPWVTDPGEMAKKTVIKRAYKLWPKTERFERVEQAIHHLNTENGEGLEVLEAEAKNFGSPRDALRKAMEGLPLEVQTVMHEMGAEVSAMCRNPEVGPDLAYAHVQTQNLDAEQHQALWYVLDSDVRSALKKAGEAAKLGKVAA
jgi:recombination protein RecT